MDLASIIERTPSPTLHAVSVRVGREVRAAPRRLFDAWLDAGQARTFLFADRMGHAITSEIDARVDQIEAWCEDILTAVDELRRRTGVQRVCLLGFRLGALLATLAARRCSAVDSLLLIAPVVSGRRYLGEMRTVVASSQLYLSPAGGAAADSLPAGRTGQSLGSMRKRPRYSAGRAGSPATRT